MELTTLEREYIAYIQSPAWALKRAERIALDNYRCLFCNTTENLQVHHRTYERFGKENIETDLATFCERCHNIATNIIREERYASKTIAVLTIAQPERNIIHVENYSIPPVGYLSPADAQRADSRPYEPLRKRPETDFEQKEQD